MLRGVPGPLQSVPFRERLALPARERCFYKASATLAPRTQKKHEPLILDRLASRAPLDRLD